MIYRFSTWLGYFLEWLIVGKLAKWFPSRYRVIPRAPDQAPLLRQFKVFSFGAEKKRGVPPWWHMSCYLQSFLIPEIAGLYHVHRWRYMRSVVLSGWFIEERPVLGAIKHRAFSTYAMTDATIHRVAVVGPRTWTLFFMVGKSTFGLRGGWGYFRRPEFRYQSWEDMIPQNKRIGQL